MTLKWNSHPNSCLWNKVNHYTDNFKTFMWNLDKNWIKLFLFEIQSCNDLKSGKRKNVHFIFILYWKYFLNEIKQAIKWANTYSKFTWFLSAWFMLINGLPVPEWKRQSPKPTRVFTEKFKRRILLSTKLITFFSKGNINPVFPYIFRLEYSSFPLLRIAVLQGYSHVILKLYYHS